ncbi:protein translocase subunit SecD [Thiohalorhabdus methylotrophus]|uniref:Protein translocase subunit SecD n=1 Tax=Thiohalorhabdus methylotrophus TaxID=3242694 RepID=A0ABV4TY87_9GAMM
MNRYPLWKYWMIAGAILLAFLYAVPTLFGTDPGLMVTPTQGQAKQGASVERVKSALEEAGIQYRALDKRKRGVAVRFDTDQTRDRARDLLQKRLENYAAGPMRLSAVPGWLQAVGGKNMNLGLDLRGGVHLLMEVQVNKAIQRAYERYVDELRTAFREEEVRYRAVQMVGAQEGRFLQLKFDSAAAAEQGAQVLQNQYSELSVSPSDSGPRFLQAQLTSQEQERLRDWAVEQSLTTMRTRVNQLGVSEPVIQRQGQRRVVVQLPGIQDTARAKEVIGSTAQLEFKLVDKEHSVQQALEEGAPPGSEVFYGRQNGEPYLLEKRTVLSGEFITDARAGFSQQTNQPLVHVSFDAKGARLFGRLTGNNVGDRMAILLDEEVITAPVIQERIGGGRAQITGMATPEEAHDVALMLRAGALPAPVKVVEERTVGPTLGQDSIEQGLNSIVIGFLLVVAFMAVYYRLFGLVANVALVLNLVFIVAVMSLLQATLTLPGIAGIVLTVGMAVDANTLIFERIREEIRVGNTPHAAISSGYGKALSTIADANITTLIAALVLFQFGSGPVKGFAVTLSVGILTSMFTAIMVTRAIINLSVGRRRLTRISIGES